MVDIDYTTQLSFMFGNCARVKILNFFLQQPYGMYSSAQIVDKTGLTKRTVLTLMNDFTDLGLMSVKMSANRNYWALDRRKKLLEIMGC